MSEKQRYFIELSYDGSNYHGWQVQPNAVTVQETLNDALTTVLRQPVETTGCGRTDTGVHAKQFFSHFDFKSEIENPRPEIGINAILPKDIAIKRIFPVHPGAHARFD
ncbi:MAG: tRNA pseudouridine(38-40) synthase TruA, partial [Mucilaginibacter sp.]